MSLETLFQDEATISRHTPSGGTDGYGIAVASMVDDPEPTKGMMQLSQKSERPDIEGRDTVIADYTYSTFATVQVTEKDQLKWNTRLLQIVGVEPCRKPGGIHHIKIHLRDVGQIVEAAPLPEPPPPAEVPPRIGGMNFR